MKIAVLAVQGAFIEHERKLEVLGASCVELRKAEDLNQSYDGLVLPGGESTVQGKLLRELGMFDTIRKQIKEGLPVLATCAGLIDSSGGFAGGGCDGASSDGSDDGEEECLWTAVGEFSHGSRV